MLQALYARAWYNERCTEAYSFGRSSITMKDSFTISFTLPAGPDRIYDAWLSSEGHRAFTHSEAHVQPEAGGEFYAWDGYISGKTIEMEPYHRILQQWRTTEFPPGSPDSILEILLEGVTEGTRVTLNHSNLPKGTTEEYIQDWKEFYETPMREYFSKLDHQPPSR